MPLGTEVDHGPGHIVFDADTAPLFSTYVSIVTNGRLLSYWEHW